jgi:hypothetical protein
MRRRARRQAIVPVGGPSSGRPHEEGHATRVLAAGSTRKCRYPFLTDQPMTLSRSRSRHWSRIPTGSRRRCRLHVHRDGPARARLTSACGVAPPVGPHDQSDTDHDDPQPEQRVTNAPVPGRPREPGNRQAETGNHKSTNPLPAGRRLRYGRPPRGRRQAGTTSSHPAERPYPAHNRSNARSASPRLWTIAAMAAG